MLFQHIGVLAEAVHGLQQVLGGFKDRHPLFGQAKAAAPALAQLDPKPGLELAHLFADGRLAKVQGRLRCGKAAALDDGGEHPEQFQIDVVQLVQAQSPICFYIGNADVGI
ncbi:hypothetical protein D9M73_222770 [compost metagenome]